MNKQNFQENRVNEDAKVIVEQTSELKTREKSQNEQQSQKENENKTGEKIRADKNTAATEVKEAIKNKWKENVWTKTKWREKE